jgi:hypothetical protein
MLHQPAALHAGHHHGQHSGKQDGKHGGALQHGPLGQIQVGAGVAQVGLAALDVLVVTNDLPWMKQ